MFYYIFRKLPPNNSGSTRDSTLRLNTLSAGEVQGERVDVDPATSMIKQLQDKQIVIDETILTLEELLR